MRSNAFAIGFALLAIHASAHPSELLAFSPALLLDSSNANSTDSDAESLDLLKRQLYCPANTNSCTSGICCSASSQCTVDAVGNPACCPLGSFCTGTLTYPSASATTSVIPPTTTTSGGYIIIIPASTTVYTPGTAATTATTAGTVSYVPNPYFPFPIIATSFSNSLLCSSAYSACATNYALCTADLQGNNGFAVTINAPAGGTTVAPSLNLGLASATSICSTLAFEACPGNVATCTVWGGGVITGVTILSGGEEGRSRQLGLLVVLCLAAMGWNM